jgi:hypothetical protein
MNSDSWARLRVAALIYCIVNAVVFGVGVVVVMSFVALDAFFWMPAVVVSSFIISAPLAWFIAPWMMMRFMRGRVVSAPD